MKTFIRQNAGVAENEGSVRIATSSDTAVVLELDRDAPVGHERGAFLTAMVESGNVILYELEGQVLGYAVLRARSFFGRDFVDLLVISPHHRRQGIGTLLLQSALSMASKGRVFTSTNRSNKSMIALLEKANWRFSGALDGIDEGDPELVYFKDAQ